MFDLDGNAEQKKKNIREYGNIYLQIIYVIEGENLDIPTLPMLNDLDEISRKKMEQDQKLIQGILKINVVMARKLRIADANKGGLSDPYCVITYPDDKTISTKTVENELNPIWNFESPKPISLKYIDYKPIVFKVMDKDTGAIDDDLGQVSIDWMECVNNPGLWMVNGLYNLEGDKKFGRDLGQIYVQMIFLTEVKDQNIEGCSTLKEVVEEYGRVIGKFNLDIHSAEGLYNSDTAGKSDPYCIAYLTLHPNESLKTPTVQNSLDPIWNYKGNFLFLDARRRQIKGLKLVVNIFDEDPLSKELLGIVEINTIPFLQMPNEPQAKDYPVQRNGKPKGSIKLGIEWKPDPRCETLEKIEELDKLITGELLVKVLNAKNLKNVALYGKTDSFFEVYSSLDTKQKNLKNTKKIPSNLNPEWNQDLTLPITKVNEEDLLASSLICKIKDWKTTLGGINIPLKDIITKPGTWLNDYWELVDEKGKNGVGWVSLQIQFIVKDSPNNATEIPKPIDFQVIEKKLEEMKPKPIVGKLVINVIGAKNLKAADIGGKSDPFCTLQLSDADIKVILKTKTIDKNLNPIWDSQDHCFDISLLKERFEALALYIKVYDYDTIGDDLIGQYQVDLKEFIFDKPSGQWFNSFLPLFNEKNAPEGASQIYLQMQWRPSTGKEFPLIVENLLAKELEESKQAEEKKKQELANIPKKTGKLVVNIISAKNLEDRDISGLSDPYCTLALSKGEKKRINTKTIDETLNPTWELMEQIFDLSLPTPDFDELKLFVKVFDYDTLISSDLLGSAVIDILPLIHQPGLWFNEFTPLMDENGEIGAKGFIYLQIQWREEGFKGKINVNPPEIYKELVEKPEEPTIKGDLFIKVVGGKNLKKTDIGGKSDPYCIVTLSQGKGNKNVKTPIKANDLNPIWNHEDSLKLDYSMKEYLTVKLFAEVFDNDFGRDEFTGKIIADIGFLFEKPGVWFNKSFSLMDKDNKSATQGELYIMAQWRQENVKIDTTLPENLFSLENNNQKPKESQAKETKDSNIKETKEPIKETKETKDTKIKETKDSQIKDTKDSKIKDSKDSKELDLEGEIKKDKSQEKPIIESSSKKEPPNIPGTVSGTLTVKIISAKSLPSMDFLGKSDPFCKFKLAKANPQLIETKRIDDNNDPVWNHEDQMKLSLPEKEFEDLIALVEVIDYDYGKTNFIGSTEINLGQTVIKNPKKVVLNNYTLINSKKKPLKDAIVTIELIWTPCE